MLNHARTLLMNVAGGSSPGFDFPGEELIAAEFAKLELPTYLDRVRSYLFGAKPDRAMLNYRCKQLMALLHSTELEQFVLDLDSRITYDAAAEHDLVMGTHFGTQANQYDGGAATMTFLGSPESPDAQGIVHYKYDVRLLTELTIEVTRLTPPGDSTISAFGLTAGLSNAISLPDTGYSFKLNTNEQGCAWEVEVFLRPTWSMGELVQLFRSIGEPTLLQLFWPITEEPTRTFYNLWNDHREMPYQLGAIVMALIWQSEQVRRQYA